MGSLAQDIKYAWRNFSRKPFVGLLIIGTLGLGIGANSAIFSVVYHVLLAPLPYENGDRLVVLYEHEPNIERFNRRVSVPTLMDIRAQSDTLSEVVEYHPMYFTLLGGEEPSRVQTGVVSWNYFSVFGIEPILGRAFLPGEDEVGARPLILLSHHYWLEKFGGDKNIVGMSLQMNNATHEVIGVLPPMPAYPVDNDIWITSASCPIRSDSNTIASRDINMLSLFGRLKEGVDLEASNLELSTLAGRIAAENPDHYPDSSGFSISGISLREAMVGNSAGTFLLLSGMTALVLLIACANVANLNLVRMASREQELAIRSALGANPARIARQVLTECILLALVGGVLGLLIAMLGLSFLSSFASKHTPLASEVSIDFLVLIFNFAVAILTGIVSGSGAAFQRKDINLSLKEGSDNVTLSSATKRLRQILLITQFCITFIILNSSSLIMLSLFKLSNQDIGFDGDNLVTVSLDMNFSNYQSQHDVMRFTQALLANLEASPEVGDFAFADIYPLENKTNEPQFFRLNHQTNIDKSARPRAKMTRITEGYHKLLGIPLLKGRLISSRDDEYSPKVVVINQSFANKYFSGVNPIGERIAIDSKISTGAQIMESIEGETWLTIIGVVGDIRGDSLDKPEGEAFYVPMLQSPSYYIRLLIESKGNRTTLIKSVKETIHGIDAQQPVGKINSIHNIKSEWMSSPRLIARLVGSFGLLAFFIALSGLVGVVLYNISQNTKEIGIRMALGANPMHIFKMLTFQGVSIAVLGLILGVAIMFLFAPAVQDLLYNTSATNITIILICFMLITLAAFISISVPAAQIMKLNPASPLKDQ